MQGCVDLVGLLHTEVLYPRKTVISPVHCQPAVKFPVAEIRVEFRVENRNFEHLNFVLASLVVQLAAVCVCVCM